MTPVACWRSTLRVPTMSSALARAGLTPINKILPIQLPELVAWSSTSGRGCLLALLRLAYLAVTYTARRSNSRKVDALSWSWLSSGNLRTGLTVDFRPPVEAGSGGGHRGEAVAVQALGSGRGLGWRAAGPARGSAPAPRARRIGARRRPLGTPGRAGQRDLG